MIKRITDFECLSGVNSPLLPILYCAFKFNENQQDGVFLQADENGEKICAFSVEGNSTHLISFRRQAINEELSAYFNFWEIKFITSDFLLFSDQKSYSLFNYKELTPPKNNCLFLNASNMQSEYKEIFDLAFGGNNDFENWYSTFSRKINAGFAQACYFSVSGVIASVACTPFIYKNQCIISGVTTEKAFQRQGFAKKCLLELASKLYDKGIKTISLWCSDENVIFYEKSGFIKQGKIYIGEY